MQLKNHLYTIVETDKQGNLQQKEAADLQQKEAAEPVNNAFAQALSGIKLD
mgnify:CR=1 FL=1